MNNGIAIQTESLHKFYGRVHALRGVDLEVERGEIFGFLGPNGAGKTTTIRCLLDLIRPTSGRIHVLGIDPQEDPVAVRARVGYLPDELHLEENLTAEGHLRYLNHLRGNRADWHYVQGLAGRLDLDLKAAIKNLSKGNKIKVGVIQALMHQPDLLILDEPTFGLDPLMQQEVLHIMTQARQAGTTIFFSSHILSEVQAVCDRVGIIRLGKLVEVAGTDELINRAMRRVHVRFKEAVNTDPLGKLAGVTILSRDDGSGVHLQVSGEMDPLIKKLAGYPVSDMETERPSLEEIFLAYYEGEATEEA
jgi:ABC-2 type transport system ATP-binding protein